MRRKDFGALQQAQLFAARFGFITQEIFFEHFCSKGRSQQYSRWKSLIDDGWFTPSARDMRVLYLSRKSRRALGAGCVPARSLTYIDHDGLTGTFLLALQRTGLVLRSWTEADLTRAPWEAYRILGADRFSKIPDLILDLRAGGEFLRVAVEIEKTRKSRARYAQIAAAYLGIPRIDLVIFGCESEAIRMEVRRAFSGAAFQNAQKIPGTFLLKDFTENEFAACFQFQERTFRFGEFLRVATRLEDLDPSVNGDGNPDRVRLSKTRKAEAK